MSGVLRKFSFGKKYVSVTKTSSSLYCRDKKKKPDDTQEDHFNPLYRYNTLITPKKKQGLALSKQESLGAIEGELRRSAVPTRQPRKRSTSADSYLSQHFPAIRNTSPIPTPLQRDVPDSVASRRKLLMARGRRYSYGDLLPTLANEEMQEAVRKAITERPEKEENNHTPPDIDFTDSISVTAHLSPFKEDMSLNVGIFLI